MLNRYAENFAARGDHGALAVGREPGILNGAGHVAPAGAKLGKIGPDLDGQRAFLTAGDIQLVQCTAGFVNDFGCRGRMPSGYPRLIHH